MAGATQGIELGLAGEVEKHSEVLGRSAKWEKRMEIASLPKYVCVEVGLPGRCDVVHAVLLEGAAR